MRQIVLAGSILGTFLAALGFISNWWTGRFETNYAETIDTLTKAYGVAAVVFGLVALWAAFVAKRD